MVSVQGIPTEATARAEWIHYRLKLAHSSFAALADELGVSRHTVRSAIDRPYPKMEDAIARKIGVPAEELWPERYARRARRQRRASTRGAA